MRIVLLFLAALSLAACSSPKVDGSTEASYRESIKDVRESVPAEKREEFDRALMAVALKNVPTSFAELAVADPETIAANARSALNGKTATEIMAEADSIRAEMKAREEAQAKAEIAELLERKERAAKDKASLANFVVERSRFYRVPQEYIGPKTVIELTVKNGTGAAVSRAYFRGTLATPGRAVPWIRDEFNYEIRGGLEPGESATWYLEPNMFSDWGQVEAREDAVFTVEVLRLDGADSNALFDASAFSEDDEKRLANLKKALE